MISPCWETFVAEVKGVPAVEILPGFIHVTVPMELLSAPDPALFDTFVANPPEEQEEDDKNPLPPGQTTTPEVVGAILTVTAIFCAVPFPQEFDGVTFTSPDPEPTFTVKEFVVLAGVAIHPAGKLHV